MAQVTQTRLTAVEFSWLPETNLPMELINGVVIAPPTPRNSHQQVLMNCAVLLRRIAPYGETCIGPNDVYLDEWNVLQPDVFWIKKAGSGCKLGDDDRWHGPPDLVVEVLSDDLRNHYDKVEKFRIYARHGVAEYWIIHPIQLWAEVWAIDGERYRHRGTFGADEAFESAVLGGKTIALAEVFVKAGDAG